MNRVRTRLRDLASRRVSHAVHFIATLFLAMSTLLVGPVTGAHASGVHNNAVTISQTGLHIFSINGRPYGIKTAIHILTFDGTKYSIAIGLAHHAIDGGLLNTSSMCKGTPGCVAAVNGDFFDFTQFGAPDPGDEVGGIIQDCVLLHSSEISHQQVNLDGHSVSNGLN